MGVIVNKENAGDELSRRIGADLRAKMIESEKVEEDADLVEDSEYVKDLKKTSRFSWVIIVLVIVAIVISFLAFGPFSF